jgi:hypothetical protein
VKIINETPDAMTFEFTREEVGVLRRAVEADFYRVVNSQPIQGKIFTDAEKSVYDYFVEVV